MKVKICGITGIKDALAAESAGADIIGMVFAESKRRVGLVEAARICVALKQSTMKAGVFVNEKPEVVNSVISALKLDFVQLSGDEGPSYVESIKGARVIKALRVRKASEARAKTRKYGKNVFAFLFDTPKKDSYGGSGETFDWSVVSGIKRRFFVAGGLDAGNVGDAIRQAEPYGVDASSRLEKTAGKKDLRKVKDFLKAARKAGKKTKTETR